MSDEMKDGGPGITVMEKEYERGQKALADLAALHGWLHVNCGLVTEKLEAQGAKSPAAIAIAILKGQRAVQTEIFKILEAALPALLDRLGILTAVFPELDAEVLRMLAEEKAS